MGRYWSAYWVIRSSITSLISSTCLINLKGVFVNTFLSEGNIVYVYDTPPEDVGGVGGYQYFLEVMSDNSHPEYEHLKDWSRLTKTAKYNQHTINQKLLKKYG